MNKITIRDIAKMANVSISAVSIVLNERPGVSPETRQKIKQIVENTGFVQNPNSRKLLFDKTGNIAVLFPSDMSNLENMFYLQLNNALLPECSSNNYNLLYCTYNLQSDKILPNTILKKDADGIIFLGDTPNEVIETVKKMNIPFVITDSYINGESTPTVYTDYEECAYKATSFLIDNGHKNIEYLGSINESYNDKVYSGYVRALKEHNLPYQSQNIILCDKNYKIAYYEGAKFLKNKHKNTTALLCCDDILAFGIIKYLKEQNIDIPNQLSIMSIGNLMISPYTDPSITTININVSDLAKESIKLLIKQINNNSYSFEHIKTTVNEIVIRKSVKKIS